MLDPTYIRDNIEAVRSGLRARGLDPDKALEELATLESVRRRVIPELEGLKRQQNTSGDEIARARRMGKDTTPVQDANRMRAQQIKQLGVQLDAVEYQRTRALMVLPNLPHASVPIGKTAADNQVVRSHGEPRVFDFEPQPHWDLGPALGIIDFERATRMAGARFSVLSGQGAQLSRALINFMLDLHTREHGYREIEPPFLVNSAALTGTGNLPKFEGDLFKIAGDWDLYLVPTAEVPLTNLHRGEILDGRELPIRYTAYTPCFRSEAGSYGQDVRGLIRQHQFDKVELVKLDASRAIVRGAGEAHGGCRRGAETARVAVPDGPALHGRHGIRVSQDVRHRGVAAEPEGLSGDFLVQQHRSVSGAAREHQVSLRGNGQSRLRPHAQRLGPRGWPHAGRDSGELPAKDGSVTIPPALRPYMDGKEVISAR